MKLSYQFKQTDLLKKALTHKSASQENNERLEYLGDALVDLIIAEATFQKFPEAEEGELSRLRAQLVRKESLADIARELKVSDDLVLGAGEDKSGGRQRDSMLADVLESLVAAIYLDSDFYVCKEVVLTWFAKKLSDLSLTEDSRDFKTRLQEHLQAKSIGLPQYNLIETTGKDHNRQFKVNCLFKGCDKNIVGSGDSKKKAEQSAAEQALQFLEGS